MATIPMENEVLAPAPDVFMDLNNDGELNRQDIREFSRLISEQQSSENPFSNVSIFDVIDFAGSPTEISNIPTETKLFDEYEKIMGLPPLHELMEKGTLQYEQTLNRVLQKSLVLTLEAVSPKYSGIDGDTGLNLFTVDKYKRTMATNGGDGITAGVESLFPKGIPGLKPMGDPFKFAVQVENSFNESWSHDFGESSFENAANVGSALGSELKFITNSTGLSETGGKITEEMLGLISQVSPGLAENLGKLATGIGNVASDIEQEASKSNLGRGLLKLASGSKVDFPMIWRGSSFSYNYSFTVKLWNPFPSSFDHYVKYILNPIYHLLLFMCPVSDSNFTYGFPMLCRMKCPGLGGIDAGFISNLDIVKGGENGDISFKQRPGSVEIRFSLQSLYNTMIIRGEMDAIEDRPTLDKYIRDLLGETVPPEYYGKTFNINESTYSSSTPYVEKVKSSEPYKSASSTPNSNVSSTEELEFLEAASDPVLNYQFTDETLLTDENISAVSNYKSDLETQRLQREEDFNTTVLQLPLQDRVALKIKHGVTMDSKLVNWFWNNTDKFDSSTMNIVKDIRQPNIYAYGVDDEVQIGVMKKISKDVSGNKPAIQTGTF